MNNLFIPVVVLVQITTITASLVLLEALRINDTGGLNAIVYTILAVIAFIVPYFWSGRLHCSSIKTTYRTKSGLMK